MNREETRRRCGLCRHFVDSSLVTKVCSREGCTKYVCDLCRPTGIDGWATYGPPYNCPLCQRRSRTPPTRPEISTRLPSPSPFLNDDPSDWGRPRVLPPLRAQLSDTTTAPTASSSSPSPDDGWGRPRVLPPMRARLSDTTTAPTDSSSAPLRLEEHPGAAAEKCGMCFKVFAPDDHYRRLKLCGNGRCKKFLCRDCRQNMIRGWCESGGPYSCVFCHCRRLTPTRDEMGQLNIGNKERHLTELSERCTNGQLYCGVCQEHKGIARFDFGVQLCNSRDERCRRQNFLCNSCREGCLQSRRALRCPFCCTESVVING